MPTNSHTKRPDRVSNEQIVRNWWSIRLSDGCQLSDMSRYVEGWDYKRLGTNRWLQAVAFDALYQDFCLFFPMGRSDFGNHLRRLVQPVVLQRTAKLEGHTPKFRKPRSFWRFQPVEACIELFDKPDPLVLTRTTKSANIELPHRRLMGEADWLNKLLK